MRRFPDEFADLLTAKGEALLAGRQRKLERAVADAAIARGLAVRTVPPARDGRHPADDLVRRADHVLVLHGGNGRSNITVDAILDDT